MNTFLLCQATQFMFFFLQRLQSLVSLTPLLLENQYTHF